MTDSCSPTASAVGQQTQQPQSLTQNVIMAKPLKVKPPESYKGTRGGLKAFFSQVELYFEFNTKQFPKDKLKVLFASTYLQGPAFNWFNSFFCDFLENTPENRDNDTNKITQSCAKFKKKLVQTFENFDEKQAAEQKMQSLQQTGSTANYTAKFQQYAAQTQWENASLTVQFYQELKDRVKDNIAQVN